MRAVRPPPRLPGRRRFARAPAIGPCVIGPRASGMCVIRIMNCASAGREAPMRPALTASAAMAATTKGRACVIRITILQDPPRCAASQIRWRSQSSATLFGLRRNEADDLVFLQLLDAVDEGIALQ